MRKILFSLLLMPAFVHAQVITTVAGNGVQGFGGDGGPATAAQLDRPTAIAFNKTGDMYVVDALGKRLRKVSATGIITTVAGDGTIGPAGDGGPATAAKVRALSVVTDTLGNVYISELTRIRKIDAGGIITTIAGSDTVGYNGDGIPATNASVYEAYLGFADEGGSIWFSDRYNKRIRKIDNTGIISTIAGTGISGSSGDGGPATAATMGGPGFLSRNKSGELFVPDMFARRTRKINTAGVIDAFAGYGLGGSTGGDGGPALTAAVAGVTSVACDDSGNAYLAMSSADVIRKVNAAGIISTVAGNGTEGFSGDGGPALSAQMNNVVHITLYNGNLYLVDMYNNRIRRIGLSVPIPSAVGSVSVPVAALYPNPASSLITVKAHASISSLRVMNMQGELSDVWPRINGEEATIDVRHLAAGVYRVVVNGSDAGSFVKQ